MKPNCLYLVILALALLACEKEKDKAPEACLVQSVAYTATSVIGSKESVDYKFNSTYNYDSNNRLVQVRNVNLLLPSSVNTSVITYSYDAQGRLLEKKSEQIHDPSNIGFVVYQYNEEGQMITSTIYAQYSSNGGKQELARYEYTYASLREIKTSKYLVDNRLRETREYTYTNGLMTKVRVLPSGLPWGSQYSYEIDIMYDDKKTPFSSSSATVLSALDTGYPYQHNIISHTARYSNGLSNDLHTYTKKYTYSEHGYPLTEQKLNIDLSIHSIDTYDYTYTCR